MTTKKKIIIAIIIILLLIGGYTVYMKKKKPATDSAVPGTTPVIQVNPASVVVPSTSTPDSTVHSDASPIVDASHVIVDGSSVAADQAAVAIAAAATEPITPLAVTNSSPLPTTVDNSAAIADLQAQLASAKYVLYNLTVYANRIPKPSDADSKLSAQQAVVDSLNSQISALSV